MVQRLCIWHCGIQRKWPIMAMENPFNMAWETHVEPPRIPSISSDHIYDYPTNGTGVTYFGIHRQFQSTWMDAQSIL